MNLFRGITTVVALENASPDAVYIGRKGRGKDGIYGNPYSYEEWGDQALEMFEMYLDKRTESDLDFRRKVLELEGKELACPGNCKNKRDGRCHGDIYVKWLLAHGKGAKPK